MSVGAGRRRGTLVIGAVATLVGVWLGVGAPDVSPVTPAPVVISTSSPASPPAGGGP